MDLAQMADEILTAQTNGWRWENEKAQYIGDCMVSDITMLVEIASVFEKLLQK